MNDDDKDALGISIAPVVITVFLFIACFIIYKLVVDGRVGPPPSPMVHDELLIDPTVAPSDRADDSGRPASKLSELQKALTFPDTGQSLILKYELAASGALWLNPLVWNQLTRSEQRKLMMQLAQRDLLDANDMTNCWVYDGSLAVGRIKPAGITGSQRFVFAEDYWK